MRLIPLLTVLLVSSFARAAVRTRTLEYKSGDTVLEGYLAYDDAHKGKAPGIVIAHQWMGLTDYEKGRARQVAELGYVVLAADLYGKGVRPTTPKEAGGLAGKYKAGDRAELRARARAALDALLATGKVDPAKVAAMGYCFGGTAALELARSGAPIIGAVSFHGGLSTAAPEKTKGMKAHILALHGADDPNVPPEEVAAFEKEMREAGVDWQLVAYGGAVHAFTQKQAGNDNSKGAAYNALADARSWQAMRDFLKELFAR